MHKWGKFIAFDYFQLNVVFFDEPVISDYSNMPSFPRGIASYADVLRGLSHVSAPRMSTETSG